MFGFLIFIAFSIVAFNYFKKTFLQKVTPKTMKKLTITWFVFMVLAMFINGIENLVIFASFIVIVLSFLKNRRRNTQN